MMRVLFYHKNSQLQLSGLKKKKKKYESVAPGVGRALVHCAPELTSGSMLKYDIFIGACPEI